MEKKEIIIMEKNTTYIVKNRSSSQVCYRIPEDGIRRTFAPGESKKIGFAELEKLTWQAGGRELMTNFLQIQNETAIRELGIVAEPEYHMSEEQVKELIRTGSLDAFLDALDFAPVGVIDLIKVFSVSIPLEDYSKRRALKEKTGFDVDTAIRNLEAEKAEEKIKDEVPAARRVQTQKEEIPAGRRTPVTYKVIEKN
jgi:hypothetical protein